MHVTAAAKTTTPTFSLKIRVPGWLELAGTVSVNGEAQSGPVTAGTYFDIQREWKDGDVVEVSFPPSLWAEPLNDRHSEYNATMAFKYGPLVLAGVNIESDIFVPKGDALKPASFITRNSTSKLEFEAVASDCTCMRMMPLRDVMLESYAVYFMTAGTKPAQQKLGYCPHSQGEEYVDFEACDDDDSALVSRGAPAPGPVASGHGVQWHLADDLFTSVV